MAPDLGFTVGDTEEGIQRMLRLAGLQEEERAPRELFRWLSGWR
jgi:hypothetical protein